MADENQQAQDLGEARETWCRVEGQSGEDWERSERSHNHVSISTKSIKRKIS